MYHNGNASPQVLMQQQQQLLQHQQQQHHQFLAQQQQQQLFLQQQQQQQEAQTADLWLKIDQLHLNYLRAEESTKKIDIRRKLEGFIHHYLCVVPHERKYCNSMTAEVVSDSCKWIPDFSALKAAQAFESLETYAANLINHPWRKEFREIKQYCGFYTHNVSSSLYGADRVLLAMGYSPCDRIQTLSLPPGEAVDMDRVVTVARDCVLAYVECQIMVAVMQGVSAHCPCSWSEVLSFRRDHVGTPEQAVRAMLYFKSQTQFQSLPSPPVPSTVQQPNGQYVMQKLQPPHQQPQQQLPMPQDPSSSFGGPALGKLIDLSSSSDLAANDADADGSDDGAQDVGGGAGGNGLMIPVTVKNLEKEHRRNTFRTEDASVSSADALELLAAVSRMAIKNQDQNSNTKNNHTQHQLETQLSQEERDLLNRKGLLHDEVDAVHPRFRESRRGKTPPSENGGSEDQVPTYSKVVKTSKRMAVVDGDEAKRSLRHSRPLTPPLRGETPQSQPSRGDTPVSAVDGGRASSRAHDDERRLYSSVVMKNNNNDDVWTCGSCTFENPPAAALCQMCSRSRSASSCSSSSSPDADAPRQCLKCTLINPPGSFDCEACGERLRRRRGRRRDR